MLARRPVLLALMAAGMVVPLASPALALPARTPVMQAPVAEGEGEAMELVKNLQYPLLPSGQAGQGGTDIEFLTLGGKDYALAGTGYNGMQIADITDPARSELVGRYDCPINQGDIQVFRQGERILATYTADSRISSAPSADGTRTAVNQARFESACVTEANALGAELDGSEVGTFLVDLTDPTRPKTVSFIEIPKGSHNQTVHPSGNFLYNSNSDLITNSLIPQITITDISDPAKPVFVQDFQYDPAPATLSEESHDIFFNATGTRAYVASLAQTLILDTTDPTKPSVVSQFTDPSNSLVHQAELLTLTRADGTPRDILITDDEFAGAAGGASCPGGGVHLYDITGDKEQDPLANKMGTWFIDQTNPTAGGVCTSHVFRTYPEQGLMTIAWYTAGVRTLDISGLADFEGGPNVVARGEGAGIKEVGNFVFPDSDTWSFKTNRISADGSFFGYGNDIARGLDVFRFDGAALGRTVPPLEPESLAPANCVGVPAATEYVDRGQARGVHLPGVDCVIARAIAQGSVQNGSKVYRPLEDVTRGQMATFILNTLRAAGQSSALPAPKAGAFDDTATSEVHRNAIETLAAAGIVQGVSGGKSYAPNAPVTREQMASFMVRSAQFVVEPDLAEAGSRRFTDVADGSTHAQNIAIGDDNQLFQGTTATTFSPKVQVKRDQMATFLTKLLVATGKGGNVTPAMGTSTQP